MQLLAFFGAVGSSKLHCFCQILDFQSLKMVLMARLKPVNKVRVSTWTMRFHDPEHPSLMMSWKRSSNFISLHLAYRKCNKNTKLRSFLAYFTRQKQFFQKTLKISAPNSFFQKMPKFFYLMLDFFNKFH